MSDIVGAKAISLVTNGGITELPHARVFRTDGSRGGRYTVVFDGMESECSCPAGQRGSRCYHLTAARLLMERERREVAS